MYSSWIFISFQKYRYYRFSGKFWYVNVCSLFYSSFQEVPPEVKNALYHLGLLLYLFQQVEKSYNLHLPQFPQWSFPVPRLWRPVFFRVVVILHGWAGNWRAGLIIKMELLVEEKMLNVSWLSWYFHAGKQGFSPQKRFRCSFHFFQNEWMELDFVYFCVFVSWWHFLFYRHKFTKSQRIHKIRLLLIKIVPQVLVIVLNILHHLLKSSHIIILAILV